MRTVITYFFMALLICAVLKSLSDIILVEEKKANNIVPFRAKKEA